MNKLSVSDVYEKVAGSADRLLYALTALSCLIFVFTVPPFQAPDEQQHFYRIYSLAEGKLMAERSDGAGGAMLPSSLPQTVDTFLNSRELHAKRPLFKLRLDDIKTEHARPIDREKREFVAFSGAIFTGHLAYAPQALGMAIGNLFGASPLDLLYWARLANMLTALAVAAFAFRMLGRGLTWGHCILALPMAQALISSASPDAMIIVAGLVTMSCLTSPLTTVRAERRVWSMLFLATIVLVTSKSVYLGAPVLAAFVMRYRGAKLGRPWQATGLGLSLLFVAVALIAFWGAIIAPDLAAGNHPVSRGEMHVSPTGQANFVLADPLRFCGIVLMTTLKSTVFYVTSTIGILGWLSVPMRPIGYITASFALALAFTMSRPGNDVSPIWIRLLAIGAVIGTMVVIELALYITWTPVGAPIVEGVQGRYFLPVLFLLALSQAPFMIKLISPSVRNVMTFVLLLATILSAHFAVFEAYY